MLKLYSRCASLLVLMAPISSGTPPFPYCTPSSTLSLSLSNGLASRLVIALMDERTKSGVSSLTLELVEVQCPATPTPSPPFASRLWHIISPVICGEIEVEGDKEIFHPHENRWMLQGCKLSRRLFLFFFPSRRTFMLYKGLVSYSIMDSWWVAITAHFQKTSRLSHRESDFYYFVR